MTITIETTLHCFLLYPSPPCCLPKKKVKMRSTFNFCVAISTENVHRKLVSTCTEKSCVKEANQQGCAESRQLRIPTRAQSSAVFIRVIPLTHLARQTRMRILTCAPTARLLLLVFAHRSRFSCCSPALSVIEAFFSDFAPVARK